MSLAHFRIEQLEFRRLLATVPSGFIDQAFGGTFTQGTAMEFAPDGRLFITTQTGSVRVIDAAGTLLGTPAITLSVDSFFERGLLGITFDPAFNAAAPGTDFVYLYYTLPAAQGGPINQISRFEVNGNTIDPGTRTEIFRFNTLSAGNHNGGAIHFGPDGMLYAAHGENAVSSNSQTVTNLLGKIVRINPNTFIPGQPESVIPASNPASFIVRQGASDVTVTPTGINRAIWAVGLRNPFTFSFEPGTGRMFINDVGQSAVEEVNTGLAGKNYGWPTTEGPFNQASFPNFTLPTYSYQAGGTLQTGHAITGGAFYVTNAPNQFPAPYQGQYFLGEYVNNWIGRINPNSPPASNGHVNCASNATDALDLRVGPDGALYYLQGGAGGNGVRRVRPDPIQAPSIIDQPDNETVFDGESATFEVVAGGAGTLSYQWTRNGFDIPGANGPMYVLPSAQFFDTGATFRCRVSSAIGIALSNQATLTVIIDEAPVPDIDQPLPNTLYTAGDTVNFSGSAFDPEDGDLAPASLEWQVDFHHADHVHPFMPATSGIASGMFTIPQIGETAADVYYRVYLRATDSLGRRAETFVDVLPRTAEIVIAANVPGLSINVDGQPKLTPHNFTGVAGIIRNLDAPLNQILAGQTYVFQNWSGTGSANHDITTPLVNTTYTATYNDITAPQVSGSIFAFSSPAPAPPHRLQVAFSENVAASLQVGDIAVTNLADNSTIPAAAIALSYDSGSNTASFSFPGLPGGVLPDGNYRLTLPAGSVADSFGNTLQSAFNFDLFAFNGDADHNRTIDIGDFAALASNFNESGTTFAEGDFDYSNLTDIGDFSTLASRFNQSLPAARRAVEQAVLSSRRSIFANSPIPTAWKGIEDQGVSALPA